MSPEESKKIFDRLEIKPVSFRGREFSKEILVSLDLLPKYELEIDGKKIWASSKQFEYGNRMAGVAYLDNGEDEPVTTLPYMTSSSQAIYRFYPGFLIGPSKEINWFAKGASEESLALPYQLQKMISTTVPKTENEIDEDDAELVLLGTSNRYDWVSDPDSLTPEEKNLIPNRLKQFHEAVQKLSEENTPENKKKAADSLKNLNRSLAAAKSEVYLGSKTSPELISGIEPKVIKEFGPDDSPEKLIFSSKEDGADFEKIVDSWSNESQIYAGKINFEVFDSKNGKYHFILCRDKYGRAWVGNIELASSLIDRWGLKEDWVDAGALTTPAFEYKSQLKTSDNRPYYPPEQESFSENSYADAYSQFLSKVPMIEEYMESVKARANK